jgi:signal transduction histidine kinase
LVLEIKDQGTGISPEVQDKLFHPFFSTKANGTGLGLAISKRIVEAHDGKMSFISHPREGTTFILALPLKRS